MPLPRTADSYVYEYIYNAVVTDPGLLELFDGNVPSLSWKMPVRQAKMPFTVYYSKMHDNHMLPYMRVGRLYFSVYDYAQDTTRAQQICDRIAKIFRMRGFTDVEGIVTAIRIFENTMVDDIPTDSETVLRYDMSFPIKWFDQLGLLEKLSRSFPAAGD